jgi:hypothetical protein
MALLVSRCDVWLGFGLAEAKQPADNRQMRLHNPDGGKGREVKSECGCGLECANGMESSWWPMSNAKNAPRPPPPPSHLFHDP